MPLCGCRPSCRFLGRTALLTFVAVATSVASGLLSAAEPELIAFRQQATNALRLLPQTPDLETLRAEIAAAERFGEVDAALKSKTLATIAINPEARVKIASALDRADVVVGRPERFLVRVENLAGIASPLRLRALDVSQVEPKEAAWIALRFVAPETGEAALDAAPLDGTTDAYFVVELAASEPGPREIRLSADAGQGTQDLGFRATADVLVRATEPAGAP